MAVTMSRPSVNAIPDGNYLAVGGLITFGVSRKKYPQIVIAIKILGDNGEVLGNKTARLTNSPNSVEMFAEALRRLGFNRTNFKDKHGTNLGTELLVRLKTSRIQDTDIDYQNCEILGPATEQSEVEDLAATMLSCVGAFLDEGDKCPDPDDNDEEIQAGVEEMSTPIPEKASRKPTEKKKKSKVVEVEQEEDIPY